MPRSQGAAVAAIAAALCLLSACVSMRVPRAGEHVAVRSGEALVSGRVRMLDASNESTEYFPFRFDPLKQPFVGPAPRMTLELRQLFPPGGAFRYKAQPAPAIEPDGSFFWVLAAGDYVLLGNPRLLGSERFTQEETQTLARFGVPASGGTIYLGTLIVNIVYDLRDVMRALRTEEHEYAIGSRRVVDEREPGLSRLRERFPRIPEPVATELMRPE